MPTEAELTQQINELRAQLDDVRLRNTPPEQRGLVQRQLDLERREQELREREGLISQAALKAHAMQLSVRTGIEASEFESAESIAAMNQLAMEKLEGFMQNPEQLARFIQLTGMELPGFTRAEQQGQGQQGQGQGQGQGQQGQGGNAPGATQSAGTPNTGGAPNVGRNVIDELLEDKNIGRGSGNLEGYLQRLQQNTPWEELRFGEDARSPLPNPADQQAQQQAGQQYNPNPGDGQGQQQGAQQGLGIPAAAGGTGNGS